MSKIQKSEIRSPKSETNSNAEIFKCAEGLFSFSADLFFSIVSDFEF